jgi:cellulose 1,4-beta-cellobiosidase
MRGSWYCFKDALGASSCTEGTPPFSLARAAMCLTGATSIDAAAFGAGLGVELDATGGASPVKSPFDAAAAGIVGFEIAITGTSNVGLRLSFTADPTVSASQPFVDLPGAGTYQVLLADAVVPGNFSDATAGARVDPKAIYAVELAVPRTDVVATYDYCITRLRPILAADVAPATGCRQPAPYGARVCAPQDLLNEIGPYAVQNNVNAGAPGSQCVQALAGGACAGFTATFASAAAGGFGSAQAASPWSYPSLVYGWQGGTFYGGYRAAKTLAAIASVATTWAFSTPSSGKWNAAYDLWLGPAPAPASAAGGVELMIWPSYSPGATPAGTKIADSVTIAGAIWELWVDPAHTDGGRTATWTYLAYRRATPESAGVVFDLKGFLDDALGRGSGGLGGAWYLLGVQAGFEIWQGVDALATTTFSVEIK